MQIKQFRYGSDNFAYLIYGKKTAVAIDAGAVDEMLAFASETNVTITIVTNTHLHYDHTSGNPAMLDRTAATFLGTNDLSTMKHIDIDGESLEILYTPGHLDDCFTFKTENFIITGDTLFNGTVGTCFSDDMHSFLDSINLLMNLPPETIIYAGHDYVKESFAFAKTIDPNNTQLDIFLSKIDPHHVFSTIEDELKVNPFVRYNDEKMIAILSKRNLPVKTEFDRWKSLFDLY